MLRTTGRLTWIESNGGPLLLLARDYLPRWEGVQPPRKGRVLTGLLRRRHEDLPATDYDRVRAVEDQVGVIDVDGAQALVIDAEPLVTTWWPAQDSRGGMLVRYIYADDEAALLRTLERVPARLWQPTGIVFTGGRSPLLLFDPLYAGNEVTLYLTIDLRPGSYAIDTALYEPDDSVALLLHRFRRV